MPNTLARPPRRPGESFSISLRRSTLVGIVVSLLVHVVAFLLVMPEIAKREREIPSPPSRNPLTARLRLPATPVPPSPEAAPQPPTPPAATPPPRPQAQRPARPQRPQQPPSRAPVITQRGPSTRSAPANPPPFRDTPLPAPFPTPPDDSSPDMTSDLRARQEARKKQEAQDGAPPGGNDTAKADDLDARIKKNLEKRGDKNGIFQVRNLGVRTAEVYFRGWGDDPRQWRGEQFDVDAGLGGNIETAVVNTVIQRIRRDYPEKDFDWESQRLNRVIKMSARKKDNAELFAFLRVELFGRESRR